MLPDWQENLEANAWRGRSPSQSCASTHQGMVRETNQDSFCIDQKTGLYMVADGMGGRAGGEVASQLAVKVIQSEIARLLPQLCKQESAYRRMLIASTINKASLAIYERSLQLPQFRGMGTTVTLLWIPPEAAGSQGQAILGHVGDSRCYLQRSGLLFQISDDHSLVSEQIKAGILAPNDPFIPHVKNVITRCVGYQEDEEVDTLALQLMPGDRFLICSDGLSNKVTDEEIRQSMLQPLSQEVPDILVEKANRRGGEDNITVVIIEF